MSEYFDETANRITANTRARSSHINDLRDELALGFEKLPTPEDLQKGSAVYGTDSGTANTYAVAMPTTATSYTSGMHVRFTPGNENTGASTLNVDGLGAKAIKFQDGTDLQAGDLKTTGVYDFVYDGTKFVLVSIPDTYLDNVQASEAAAAASEAAAAMSESNAAASEANASASASAASTSETNASNSASAAATSESNAATSETNAAASASAASTSETNAAASESAAGVSETNAAASASAASTSETNAAASETAAATSESNAAASETAAATSASNAAASESAAATSASNAASSASAAATSETNAAASESAAGISETNAASSASAAATSETNAAASETAAGVSETNAAASETAAATSESNAAALYDSFDDRYLGAKASDPTTDNDGDPLQTGALYFNTVTGEMKLWNGEWVVGYVPSEGDIPTQIGNTGKFLSTTGSTLVWTELQEVEQPTITSPLDGATGVLLTPTIQFSPYYSLYGKPQQALRVQISTVSDFATTVVDETLGAVSEYTPSSNLDTLTGYYVRGMYQDDDGTWSAWTPTINFTTADIYIEQPTITSPASGATDIGETPTFTTDAFNCINGTDTHTSSSWYLYRTSDESLVWSSVGDTTNLTSIDLPSGTVATSTEYRLEVIHTGTTYGASDAGLSTYTTSASFGPMSGIDSGPGPTTGDYDATTDTGYYGLVSAADLCDGPTLATDIGLSAGTAFNDTTGWLKFYVGASADCNKDGVAKVLFIAKETLRYDLSWDDIYLAGAVYGTGDNGVATASTGTTATQDAQVTYGSTTYKVRLLTGSATDPTAEGYGNQSCADDAGGGSEWNDLLYRVHTDIPNCTDPTEGMPGGSETTRHGGPQDGANWATYTDVELQTYYSTAGDGTYFWCQEQGNDTARRVRRGGGGVAAFDTYPASGTGTYCGWRPCLEVVQS